MKMLIQSINYYPDLTGIAKYTYEMANWFNSKGHKVIVITAPPYYPKWKINSGYNKYIWNKEIIAGVVVWRCPIWVPSKPNGIKRILHLASFAISSFPIIMWHTIYCPNIILSIEPPFFTAPAALFASWLSGAKAILHIQDYEVDAAFNMGILKGDWLKKITLAIEKSILKRFDLVCTISRSMINKGIDKGIIAERLYLFPNWAEFPSKLNSSQNRFENKLMIKNSYREYLKLPSDGVVALYSGNMGEKQGLEILGQVASKFKVTDGSLQLVQFVFCGDGAYREKLIEQCKGLNFVHFLELQSAENLNSFLAMADIHLLPQRADASDLVMPSKLTGILASGKPVLATAHIGTELANVVQNHGLVVPPENPQVFYDALLTLILDHELREKLGKAAYVYAEKNLNRDKIISGFESKLKEII